MNEENDFKKLQEMYEETKEAGRLALRECNVKILASIIMTLISGFALFCSTMLLLGYSAMIFYIAPFALAAFYTVSSICVIIKHMKSKMMIKGMQRTTDILTNLLINKREAEENRTGSKEVEE